MTQTVHVAVGVICSQQTEQETEQEAKQEAKQYFLTKRHQHVHQGGKWEFPGGKVEANETVAQALARELKEEVAIEVLSCQPLIEIKHDYGDKKVCLDVFLVDNYQGKPTAQEGQQQAWFTLAQLHELDLPAANKAILETLSSAQ